MAQRNRTTEAVLTVQVGTNRGGRAFVDALPAEAGERATAWALVDAKPGRAAELAARLHARFPAINAVAQEADGRDVTSRATDNALVISTVDTVAATRTLVESRKPQQSLFFQLVGRGPGSAIGATRLGLSGIVQEAETQVAAALLLEGFETISADASSRALTAAGDPVSAALLQPMRLATTRRTVRAFAEVLRGDTGSDVPLTFFTSAGEYPLVVHPNPGALFSVQKALALELAGRITVRHRNVAAVAFVDLEERSIDVLFVARARGDGRRVEGVIPFRAPSQRFGDRATWTD